MKKVVISLGGSTIVPDEVNHVFLRKFKTLLSNYTKERNARVVVVTGGGKTARKYIDALREEKILNQYQNLVGIESTRLNALLLCAFFKDYNLHVPTTLAEAKKLLKKHRIVICGGLGKGLAGKGSTSDGTTAEIGAAIKADVFINITNVKGLFNKDPRKHRDAHLVSKISFDDVYNKYIKKMKERPGQHFIIDSKALKICRKAKLPIVVLKGLKNLEKCLNNKIFVGTVIR